jgi:oligosaccharide repeat unit polymerase
MIYKSIKQSKLQISKLSFFLYVLFLITWLVFALLSSKIENTMQNEYFIVLLGYFVVSSMFIIYSIFNKVDIFEPLPLVTYTYIIFFSILPLLDLLKNDMYFFGYYVADGTIKATYIFIIGYITYFIGYCTKNTSMNKQVKSRTIFKKIDNISGKKIMWINLILWTIGFLSSIIFLIGLGKSPLYALTFGFGGGVQKNFSVVSSVAFLGMFSNAMVVPWVYLVVNTKSIFFKVLITFFTASIYYVIGFRFIIVIMIIAPIVYHYISIQRRPSISKIIIIIIILTIISGLVGYVRNDVRRGSEVNWSKFGVGQVWYGIESNFEIYKAFYKMVEVIPENYSYTMGRQMSYTLTIMIPRFVWPNKPDTPLREVLRAILGDYGVAAGSAWPNIGEFYSEFGVFGVGILMYLFGVMCKKSMNLYISANTSIHKLIAYSVLFPTYLQIIIRGYSPTNFWQLAFFAIPIWINSKLNSY